MKIGRVAGFLVAAAVAATAGCKLSGSGTRNENPTDGTSTPTPVGAAWGDGSPTDGGVPLPLFNGDVCVDTAQINVTNKDYTLPIVQSGLPCDRGPLPNAIPAGWNVPNNGANQIQIAFNYYSWLTFIGMNWPVGPNGNPDISKKIGQDGDNPTVWETWKNSYQIFLEDGSDPGDWDTPRVPPKACAGKFQQGMPILQQLGKTPLGVVDENQQPFKTGPLVDQNGRYVRFQILVNRPMFEHIRRNKLYNKAAQQNFGPVRFPCGSNELPADTDGSSGFGKGEAVRAQLGPIMVKAAWKILDTNKDDVSRFHTTQVLVYTPPSENPTVQERCEPSLAGLVGLHIVHKTTSAPQWIWSTFEHVDNVPDTNDVAQNKLNARYNFFTPNCKNCTAQNEPPPKPWNPNLSAPPSQIVRVLPIAQNDVSAPPINSMFQKALSSIAPKSVWKNYQLISAQWPSILPTTRCQISPVKPMGEPIPEFLANSTLESYTQRPTPETGSSCISCHNNATTLSSKHADFTYLLERAH